MTPANGENLGQILKVLASGKIVSLAERAPDAPPAVVAIVDDLLRIEKTERPASAEIVLQRIDATGPLSEERVAAGTAGAASRTEMRSVTPKPATRDAPAVTQRGSSSKAWIAGIAAAVLLAGGIGVTLTLKARSSRAPVIAAASSTSPSPSPSPPPVAAAAPLLSGTGAAAPSATAPETATKDAPVPAPSGRVGRPAAGKRPATKPAAAAPAASAAKSPLLDNPNF
jgi:hypothetical protein